VSYVPARPSCRHRYAPSAIAECNQLTDVLPDVGPTVRRRQELRLDAAMGSSARAAALRVALLEDAAADRDAGLGLHEDRGPVDEAR